MVFSADQTLHQAVLAMQAGQPAAAERLFKRTLELQPKHIGTLNLFGIFLMRLGRFDEAERYVRLALQVDARSDSSFCNYGLILKALKRPEDALAQFNQALRINPSSAQTWNDRGTVLNDLRRYREAIADFDQATKLDPNYAAAFYNKGNALAGLKLFDQSVATYNHALALKSGFAEAWAARGDVLHKLKRHSESASSFATLLNLKPDHPFAKGMLLHQKMMMCDWSGLDALIHEIECDLDLGKLSAEPFGWQAVSNSPRNLQRCAELFNSAQFPTDPKITPPHPPEHKKIRIGYLGDVFREQAVSYLVVGALELADKSCFELYGFDNGWDDRSETRHRVNNSLMEMIDISSHNDMSAAAIIREHEIDILVNLNVYFGDHRTGVFAKRPAPIQVNYLGFPATLGAIYSDYIIADPLVIPPNDREYYTEKVVYLPECYQANDQKKSISVHDFSRAQCDLPEDGFVFCCFNNNFKITPDMFDRWMRILRKTTDSVLWLIDDNSSVAANLRTEAKVRGVNPDRLIFAKRMRLPEHLARHRLADLFVDTLPYNAHTTASDALWAGLPVLTQLGSTFPGRVAASLLTAVGLPELITSTPQAYEDLAIELAASPEKLAAIKRKLAKNRQTKPLFDTRLYARRLDAAYAAMYERYRAGLLPDHIEVCA
jgi:predicted O-linked N-acetylglucosamine transferase (SPINDLY family)